MYHLIVLGIFIVLYNSHAVTVKLFFHFCHKRVRNEKEMFWGRNLRTWENLLDESVTMGRVDESMQAALPWDSTVVHMCCVPGGQC